MNTGASHPAPCVIWFTGLSGAGKSTLASLLAEHLQTNNCEYTLLDGDALRRTKCRDLGFSADDRRENIRRLGALASEAVAEGKIALVAAISPFEDARRDVRQLLPPGRFVEVFVDSPLAVCELRDPKGLYKKARSGVIPLFTGIDSPYEMPQHPEVRLRTDCLSPEECIARVVQFLARVN